MLPRLNDNKENKEQEEQPRDSKAYTLDLLTEEEVLNAISKNTNGGTAGEITGEILLRTPKGFFRKYEPIVEGIVRSVQERLAEEGTGAALLDKSRRNPTDLAIQLQARDSVKSALIAHNDSAVGGSKLRNKKDIEIRCINALVMDEILGFGPLDPLWRDTRVTEIIANGPHDIQVEIAGTIHEVPACRFRDQAHLMDLINRLYSSINKTLSRNEPMVKGRLYDKSRMMAIHPIVAPDGPNFNIRRHSNDFITPEQLIGFGTSDIPLMTELGNLINAGVSIAVIGGTGSGKTTLLDALTSYIPNNKRCISLEDNLEMKPHPNKLFAAAMEVITPKPGSTGDYGVTMRDLVKASLQMRPETIIVGEVTDSAAYDLCQALNTGHDGMSTIHANDSRNAMYRLMSLISQSELVKEHAAYDLIAAAFDIIVCVNRFLEDGSRKIVTIHEIGNRVIMDEDQNKTLPLIPLWEYQVNAEETIANKKVMGSWVKVNELSDEVKRKHNLDIKKPLSWDELKEVAKITNKDGAK